MLPGHAAGDGGEVVEALGGGEAGGGGQEQGGQHHPHPAGAGPGLAAGGGAGLTAGGVARPHYWGGPHSGQHRGDLGRYTNKGVGRGEAQNAKHCNVCHFGSRLSLSFILDNKENTKLFHTN